jgi:hypothetical protein
MGYKLRIVWPLVLTGFRLRVPQGVAMVIKGRVSIII